ncbi:hypothetical protein ACLX1H_009996 [Fusarium chlamydosporum]
MSTNAPPDCIETSTGAAINADHQKASKDVKHHPLPARHHFLQFDLQGLQQPSPKPPFPVLQHAGFNTEQNISTDQRQSPQNPSLSEEVATTEDTHESEFQLGDSKPIHLQTTSHSGKSSDPNSPRPDSDVSFEDVNGDEAVTEYRLAKGVIPKELLTRGEKMRLLDLLKQYQEVQRMHGIFCSTSETYQCFYEAIFRRSWDSKSKSKSKNKSKSASPVVLRPPRSSDTCLEIGYCEKDAPSSQSDEGRRESKALKQTIPVFLTLNLETGEIDWRYHDKDGKRFEAHDVTLHHGLSIEQAKKNVLDHQDKKERKRICDHNVDQIVHAARRRIIKWAEAGSDAQLGVDNEDRVSLVVLELPSERFIACCEEICALRDYLILRPKPGYKE